MKREDLGNWLDNTGGDPESGPTNPWGLPGQGSRSRARLGRRVVALLIDWWASWLVAYLAFGETPWGALGVFALMHVVLLATTGASFGHLICGMSLVRVEVLAAGSSAAPNVPQPRRGIGLGSALIRTVLLCLVIPAVVWDADGRGLHDKAARTVLLRR